jgi:PAS domain S-box-containing protein
LGCDERGNPATVTEVDNDITALKDANERLEESETRFRQFAEAMPGMVWIVDLQQRSEFCNSYFMQYTGLSELCGHWAEIVHPEDQPERLQRWREALDQGVSYQAEYRLRRWDGEFRWHVARAVPMRDADGRVVKWFGALTDIDDQKRSLELLEKQTRELERSNSDLEHFAAVASHDLQEPLRAVTGFAHLLEERIGKHLDSDGQEFLAFIQDGAEQMQQMITSLLTYARVGGEPVQMPLIEVRPELDRAMANLRTSILENGAEVIVDDLPSVRADSTQIVQLFQNLLSNSLKYRRPEPLQIEVKCERQQAYWLFQVRDNGIGFGQANALRIFNMFRRLHGREHPGTGIGLALCQRIVERHRGRIWAEGEPDKGATFFFTLPAE